MSASSYQNEVSRLQSDIGDLRSKIANEGARIARINDDISSITRSMNSSSSVSSLASEMSRLASKQAEGARISSSISDLEKRMGSKMSDLGRAQTNLANAQAYENRQLQDAAKRHEAETKRTTEEQLRRSREVTREYERQSALQSAIRRQAMTDLAKLPSKIKVLFCAADPQDENRLALGEEVRSITEKIRASKHREAVELQSIWAVRSSDLLQALNEHEPQIVHFSGHGSRADEIIFQDAAGNAKAVSKTAIVQMLASSASNLRLVIFNTCFSQHQADEMTQHVDAAVGMATSIGDEAARNFSAQFYSAIGFGLSLQQAYNQAVAFLSAENEGEEQTPILFTKVGTNADEIILVKP